MQDASPPGRSAVPGQDVLLEVLERAKALGFLGKGPVQQHVRHALTYATAVQEPVTGRVADLGTGGGIPALPLALAWPDSTWTLVDRGDRRTAFLQDAVRRLGLQDRVVVVTNEAERLGHDPQHRGQYDVVTARSFGPPAQLAENAAALLAGGGRLVVSEPPEADAGRWPEAGLDALGLGPVSVREADGTRIAVIEKVGGTPDRSPRRKISGWLTPP